MLILGNIIFLIGFSFCVYELFCWKKSSSPLCGLLWLSISIWGVFCLHVLIAAVYNALTIPIGTLSIGGTDFILSLLFHRYRQEKKQLYLWHKIDVILISLLFFMTCFIGLMRFGVHLDMVYRSTDGMFHYYEAFHVFESSTVKAMYFSSLNGSFLISMFAPFVRTTRLYHVEPIADLWWFFLSGITILGIVRDRCKNRFSLCAGFVIGVLYLLGYPLNNLLMGFLYLGVGISLAGVVFILMDFYMEERIMSFPAAVFLMLGCLGLITCYAFFVPPVFLAVGISYLCKHMKSKDLFHRENLLRGIFIFVIPCFVGFAYTWSGIFTDGVTLSSAIALDGLIYRNNYSDYIPILPLALAGFIMGHKNKDFFCARLLCLLEFFYMAFMLFLSLRGYVSTYYYYKNNYFIWLLLHIQAIYALQNIQEKQAKQGILVAGCVWLIPLSFSLTGFEEALQENNPRFSTELHGGGAYCAVFRDNYIEIRKWRQNPTLYVAIPEKVELYEAGYALHKENGASIYPVANGSDRFFENIVTNQWNLLYLNIPAKKSISTLEDEKSEYICVIKDYSVYQKNPDYFDKYPKIFENSAGFIAVYDNRQL